MKNKPSLLLVVGIILLCQHVAAQCNVTYPAKGTCSGCTNNPSGSITLSTAGQKVCYSGTGTISTLTFNASNDTVYICGNITVTNWGGYGSSPVLVVNPNSTFTLTNAPSNYYYQNIQFVNYGTFNASSSWTNFYASALINAATTAIMNFSGSLTTTGGTIYMNGGFLNVSGSLYFNTSNMGCFSNNAIINAATLQNTGSPGAAVPSGSAACFSLTSGYTSSNDPIVSTSSPGTLNVCAQGSASNYPSAGSTAWGGAVVALNCNTQCNLILPVPVGELSLARAGAGVELDWTAYVEDNIQNFEIQRSPDGNRFVVIGQLPVTENAASANRYRFTDPSPEAGLNFYRLRILDDNGGASYSEIEKIDLSPSTEMKVIAGQGHQSIGVLLPRQAGNGTLRLIDMQGRVLKTIGLTGSPQVVTVPLPALSAGVYIIECIFPGMNQSRQFYFQGQ